MRFESLQLAADLGGRLVEPEGPRSAPPVIDGVAIDSRLLRRGQLFAALRDERDGHDFVPQARAGGAEVVLVQHPVDGGWAIVVPDVARGLIRLAGLARRRLPEFVVGITGSVGKTTTKDLLGSVLTQRFATVSSPQSFNNELGVPITLANAPEGTEAVVVEMGARGHGHISMLCSMAHPTVGVVTAVQAVHTEHMGDEAQIAVAKRELVEHLPPEGLAVLHAGDPRVRSMASHTRASVLTFGGGDVGGGQVAGEVHADHLELDEELRPRFTLRSPWGSVPVEMGSRGIHNVPNALAAATVGLWAGMSPESVAHGLSLPIGSRWRMELTRRSDGLVVLNDSYNAGPASMAAALRSLASLPARTRVAVLGVMAELGDRSAQEHLRIAELADELGIEVIAVGTDLYGRSPLADADAAVVELRGRDTLGEGTAVLVKGSRVAALESVAEALLD